MLVKIKNPKTSVSIIRGSYKMISYDDHVDDTNNYFVAFELLLYILRNE